MEIGANFDDDFFEEPKGRKLQKSSEFKPKYCNPLWFMDPKLKHEDDSDLDIAKHQADLHYFSKDYPKAVEAYEKCLELVPPPNSTLKREFMENITRSLLHLGEAEKALAWSLKFHACSINADQRIVSMNLIAKVCHKLGKYKEELEALHFCIEAHKCCPEFWMRLGYCYAGLFKINLPGSSVNNSETEEDSCCAFNSKVPSSSLSSETDLAQNIATDTSQSSVASTSSSSSSLIVDAAIDCNYRSESACNEDTAKCDVCSLGIQIVSTCLIQTRILMDSTSKLFGSDRKTQNKEMINASLKHMEVQQSFIDEASKVLGPEFLAGLQDSTSSNLLNKTVSDEVENKC